MTITKKIAMNDSTEKKDPDKKAPPQPGRGQRDIEPERQRRGGRGQADDVATLALW